MSRVSVVAITVMLFAGSVVGCNKAQQPKTNKSASPEPKVEEDWQPEVAKDPHASCDHSGHDHSTEEKNEKKADDNDTHDHSGHDCDGHAK